MNTNYNYPYQQKQEPPILPFTPPSPVEGKAVEYTFRVKYFAWLIWTESNTSIIVWIFVVFNEKAFTDC